MIAFAIQNISQKPGGSSCIFYWAAVGRGGSTQLNTARENSCSSATFFWGGGLLVKRSLNTTAQLGLIDMKKKKEIHMKLWYCWRLEFKYKLWLTRIFFSFIIMYYNHFSPSACSLWSLRSMVSYNRICLERSSRLTLSGFSRFNTKGHF